MKTKLQQSGLSLIELMIAATIAMIMSIAAISIYINQMKTYVQTSRKEMTEQDARAVSVRLQQLLRQAVICTNNTVAPTCSPIVPITVSYKGATAPLASSALSVAGKSVQVVFELPAGYAIWPNTTAPYSNKQVTLDWTNKAGAAQEQVRISNGGVTHVLSGDSSNTKIINLDFWPLNADGSRGATATTVAVGGYLLNLTARIGVADLSYINQKDPNNALGFQHYRTVTFDTRILPRN